MSYKVNIVANEFVIAGFIPTVESDTALDAQSAQSAIRLAGTPTRVKLGLRGKRATLTEAPGVGSHQLEIENLHTTSGGQVLDRVAIPFFVVQSAAKLPRGRLIQGFVRLAFGATEVRRLPTFEKPRGRYVEVMKTVDRSGGAPRELAFDEAGRSVDIAALREKVTAARMKRFGKLSPTLFARAAANPRSRLPVVVWALPADSAGPLYDKVESDTPDAPTKAKLAAAQKARETIIGRLQGLGIDRRGIRADTRAPAVHASLTAAELRAVAKDPSVGIILLDEDETAVLDLSNAVAIANADDVQTGGNKGKGVKVAVWEDGPDDATDLTIAARYTTTPATSRHARLTHAIIRNKQASGSKGYAPECSLYSANSTNRAALTWAADQGCTVISQSFHRSHEPSSDHLESDDLYKDWLALQWPYPTIVQAAGNFWGGDPDNIIPPDAEYVNHKGYNSLAVGNHDDTAGAMSGSSVYRNPSTTHGDRELPEICANGTGVTAAGRTDSGTSFSAPGVAGCAALLQCENSTLKTWPEGCRAILLAGAKRNVLGSTWWRDVVSDNDTRDGAGAVDARESVEITKSRKGHNNTASRRGWNVGTLRSADFGADRLSTFGYRVSVPASGERHVKVALAWNSKVTGFTIFGVGVYWSSLTLDLDLMVYDSKGTLVGYSGSWDNSYEIAEFDGKPGETYTIRVRRWSGKDDTWYGLAWTVV